MQNRARFSLPVNQPWSPSPLMQKTASAPLPGFVPCPAALLTGLSQEQLSEIAALYERAWEQARQEAGRGLARRFSFPFDGNPGAIGLN